MFSRKKVSNVTPTINLRNKGERTIIHCVAWKAVLETTTCAEKTVTWSSRGPHLRQGTKASRMNAACKHVNIYVRWLAFHVSIITLFKMSRGVVQNNTGGSCAFCTQFPPMVKSYKTGGQYHHHYTDIGAEHFHHHNDLSCCPLLVTVSLYPLPPPETLVTTDLFSFSIISSFPNRFVSGIMQYVTWQDCLLRLA